MSSVGPLRLKKNKNKFKCILSPPSIPWTSVTRRPLGSHLDSLPWHDLDRTAQFISGKSTLPDLKAKVFQATIFSSLTGLSLQSAVGLTAVVRFGSGRVGLTRGRASLEASTPRFVATASIAWILAVTAAAATAEALQEEEIIETINYGRMVWWIYVGNLGIACGTPPAPRFLSPGGVTARPTLRSWPPRSNRFILLIASYDTEEPLGASSHQCKQSPTWADCSVSYSI